MWFALGIGFSLLFWLVALACWVANFLGLPALWVLVAISAANAWWIPDSYLVHMPWWSVVVLAGLALLGELVEFAAGAMGVGRLGGTRRSAALAIVGSFVGAVVGLFIALPIPIPIVGPLIGSLFASALGAMVGAWIGEQGSGRDSKSNLKVGLAAFVGRILGTLGKSICGAVMVALVTVLVFT